MEVKRLVIAVVIAVNFLSCIIAYITDHLGLWRVADAMEWPFILSGLTLIAVILFYGTRELSRILLRPRPCK